MTQFKLTTHSTVCTVRSRTVWKSYSSWSCRTLGEVITRDVSLFYFPLDVSAVVKMMIANRGGEDKENSAVAALAAATDNNACAVPVLVNSKQQQQQQQQPVVCTLRRSEMACLKTALAVIVLKRRFEAQLAKKIKKYKTNDACHSLMAVTGEAFFFPMVVKNGSAATAHNSTTTIPHSSNSTRSTVRFSSSTKLPKTFALEKTAHQLQLPLALDKNWDSHLQHILQLIWRRHPVHADIRNHHHHDHRWDSLCVHVACQLEQAAEAGAQGGPKICVVPEWLYTQWTSFRVAELPAKDTAADDADKSDPAKDESLRQQSLWGWTSIWQAILRAKPEIMSELMVPVLLKLLLSSAGSSTSAAPTKKDMNDMSTATKTTVVRLESVHMLHLLEQALEKAPRHVMAMTLETLSPALLRQDTDSQYYQHSSHSVLPALNSSWCSTQDLANDYYEYYHHHQSTTTTAGTHFLLTHGLASISEMLTHIMSSSSSSYQGGGHEMTNVSNCNDCDASGEMVGVDTLDNTFPVGDACSQE